MRAFHNSTECKQLYLDRVKAHRAADNLVRGVGWENGRGCAVGCTLEAYDHTRYPIELGIPEWLARVEDTLFEHVSVEFAMSWPERFLAAIPVGADLEAVKAPFLIYVLEGALQNFDHEAFPDCKAAIDGVIALWRQGNATPEQFATARSAAWSARSAADIEALKKKAAANVWDLALDVLGHALSIRAEETK